MIRNTAINMRRSFFLHLNVKLFKCMYMYLCYFFFLTAKIFQKVKTLIRNTYKFRVVILKNSNITALGL